MSALAIQVANGTLRQWRRETQTNPQNSKATGSTEVSPSKLTFADSIKYQGNQRSLHMILTQTQWTRLVYKETGITSWMSTGINEPSLVRIVVSFSTVGASYELGWRPLSFHCWRHWCYKIPRTHFNLCCLLKHMQNNISKRRWKLMEPYCTSRIGLAT